MREYKIVKVGQSADLHKSICVAIANIRVEEKNVHDAFLEKPNTSKDRLFKLNRLLRAVVDYNLKNKKPCQLLVFPEVSIPTVWKNRLITFSRKHQIGVIFGLEHETRKGKLVLNRICCALPYRTKQKKRTCLPVLRLKRYYSPHETYLLEGYRFKVPEKRRRASEAPPYHLFQWRGASFAVYNCYELANIQDRCIFKGKVDFIVCVEYNPDVNYFSNIVEAVSRDIHCYVVQVNDSYFGDSRIISPSKTDSMSVVKIKGGDNEAFVVATLDLKGLREFQRCEYTLQRESKNFKPTPPGLKKSDVMTRIKLGDGS